MNLSIVITLIKLVSTILGWLERARIKAEGKAEANAERAEIEKERIAAADAARADADDISGVHDDPFNRDARGR